MQRTPRLHPGSMARVCGAGSLIRDVSRNRTRIMSSPLTIIGPLVVAAFLGGCVCKDVPVAQRLADCTNSTLRFQMTVKDFPPYQFVLGMSQTATGQLSFRGEIIVNQNTGTVTRVPIASHDITSCNW